MKLYMGSYNPLDQLDKQPLRSVTLSLPCHPAEFFAIEQRPWQLTLLEEATIDRNLWDRLPNKVLMLMLTA